MIQSLRRGKSGRTSSDACVARKKAEKDALLAAEEASLPNKAKSAPKAGAKKKAGDKLPPGGIIATTFSTDDPLGLRKLKGPDGQDVKIDELSADGLDQMLEALEIVNQKTDKDALGAKVS